MKPFHLSFVVPDLNSAKEFYTEVLNCSVGRDKGDWLDVLFFGHQITMHQSTESMEAKPIDHFGPILEKAEWLSVMQNCEKNNIDFVMQPLIRNEGSNEESGKFIIKDPAKNLIEFKYYKQFETTVLKYTSVNDH